MSAVFFLISYETTSTSQFPTTLPNKVKPPPFVISTPTQEEEHILKLQGSLLKVKCYTLLRSSPSLRFVGMTKGEGSTINGGTAIYGGSSPAGHPLLIIYYRLSIISLSPLKQIPCWRLDAEEVLDKEVVHLVGTISTTHGVALARQIDELEVFVVLDELVHHLEC